MPRRDGTGPLGQGGRTGRGFGYCDTGTPYGRGFFQGARMGRGMRCYANGNPQNFSKEAVDPNDNQEWLKQQKAFLEARLSIINEQLADK